MSPPGGGTPFLLGDVPEQEQEPRRTFGLRALAAVAVSAFLLGAVTYGWLVRVAC